MVHLASRPFQWQTQKVQASNLDLVYRLCHLLPPLRLLTFPARCKGEPLRSPPGRQDCSQTRGLGGAGIPGRKWPHFQLVKEKGFRMAAVPTPEVASSQRQARPASSSEAPLLPTHLVVSLFSDRSYTVQQQNCGWLASAITNARAVSLVRAIFSHMVHVLLSWPSSQRRFHTCPPDGSNRRRHSSHMLAPGKAPDSLIYTDS